MKRNLNVALFLVFFLKAAPGDAQSVELKYDTLQIISLARFDSNKKVVVATTRYISINGLLYEGSLIRFNALKCFSGAKDKDLYVRNFEPVVDEKSIDVLLKKLKRHPYRSPTEVGGEGTRTLLQEMSVCIGSQSRQAILYSDTRVVAAYFLYDCVLARGVDEVPFCSVASLSKGVPVIMKVIKYVN